MAWAASWAARRPAFRKDTTEVLLEVAYSIPIRTAATGRKLGILSDARYRFRARRRSAVGSLGADVATRLILELCGGEASEIFSSGVMPTGRRASPCAPIA